MGKWDARDQQPAVGTYAAGAMADRATHFIATQRAHPFGRASACLSGDGRSFDVVAAKRSKASS